MPQPVKRTEIMCTQQFQFQFQQFQLVYYVILVNCDLSQLYSCQARALKRLQLCGNTTLHPLEANALRLMTQ